jgi:hypothetical protein
MARFLTHEHDDMRASRLKRAVQAARITRCGDIFLLNATSRWGMERASACWVLLVDRSGMRYRSRAPI